MEIRKRREWASGSQHASVSVGFSDGLIQSSVYKCP